MRRLSGQLTYANVVSTLALFIAIGGASAFAASQLGKNTVGPKQLRRNSVTTSKLRNGAVTGAKINTSTLGTVPSAVNAQTLGGLSADQIDQSSKVRCPTGTEPAAGVCFEAASRPGANFEKALEICGRANRSLPSAGEMAAYLLAQQTKTESWVGSHFHDESQFMAPVLVGDSKGIQIAYTGYATDIPFRCITQAVN